MPNLATNCTSAASGGKYRAMQGGESSRFDGDYRANRADFGTITLQLSHETMRDIDTKAHSGMAPKHTFATPQNARKHTFAEQPTETAPNSRLHEQRQLSGIAVAAEISGTGNKKLKEGTWN